MKMVINAMRSKLIIGVFILILFSIMNTYSRALRHINIKDVKQKHQEKIVEKLQEEIRKKEERQYIQSVMETKKYDWRKELNEMMTTSDVFFTTLPATGDVNLAFPDWDISTGQGYSVSGGTVTISATGKGPFSENGFITSFDSSIYDTVVFDVIAGSNAILGVFGSGLDPLFTGTLSSIFQLLITSSGTYSVSSRASLFLLAPESGSTQIRNLRYQRRTPMNVFVSLDSPEATSFIRSDPNLSNLSPEERRKKLIEMLEASDEYVAKMLGADFPGTGAVPPGEYDPFKQAPPGQAGDTPGVEVSNFDISKMEKDYGQVAGSMNTPSSAIKFMQDLMKDGFAGNEVKTTVNGQRMTGRPAEIIQQIKLNFPGGV
jgi:hypothetical protein